MSLANDLRGEASVMLAGVEYALRPSHEAILRIEKLTGMGLLDLADAAATVRLGNEPAAIVVTECIKAQGKALADRDMQAFDTGKVGSLIYEAGLMQVLLTLALMLHHAATGGYTAAGERKAQANQTETPAAA